ncbi:cytochrome c-like domain-containing protein [Amylostereum chailletii]|nr:cytochrome c-like domain-containing protein [Amylostereum chailletii]
MSYGPDAKKGAALFKAMCTHCHTLEEGAPHMFGPNLRGMFGRKAGTLPGFKFTPANRTDAITWDERTFFDYLEAPKKYIPGTSMPFGGVKKAQDRNDLIAYMKQAGA